MARIETPGAATSTEPVIRLGKRPLRLDGLAALNRPEIREPG